MQLKEHGRIKEAIRNVKQINQSNITDECIN